MLAKPYPFLVPGNDGRQPAQCLSLSGEFNARPLQQRVVSSTFKPRGFSDYRLHADVTALCQGVERTAVPQRNFNVVIPDGQPVRWYADLDKVLLAAMDQDERDLMLAAMRDVVEAAFVSAYPDHPAAAAGLGSDRWWYFSASNPTKASFHIHADPDSPHPVWSSVVELSAFVKQHVMPLLQRELRENTPRARRLSYMKKGKLDWVIDSSVYNRNQNLKLPLCCKPGKTTMALHRAPDGVLDTSECKQLQVGMPQVWPHSPAVGIMLPSLLSSSSRARAPAAAACGGASKSAASASSSAGSSHQAAIVLQLLQQADKANVGATACWSSFTVDAAARTAQGTLAKKSARCPFAQSIHNSNQLKVSIRDGKMCLSCWAPACVGRKIVDEKVATILDELFPRMDDRSQPQESRQAVHLAHGRSSPDEEFELDQQLEIEREIANGGGESSFPTRPEAPLSSGSRPSFADTFDSSFDLDDDSLSSMLRSSLKDNTELDEQLSIERDLKAQLAKERELVNFGMPLRMDYGSGVRMLNERHLLPRTLEEAEVQMKELMLHARLGIRSGMDTAKSSAFILYIQWLLLKFPALRILLVSCRLTLTASLMQRLTKAGIPCTSYLNSTVDDLREAQVAIVQLDSLWKLEGARAYDLVLMDECESTLFHFHADTLKRRSDVWQRLKTIILQATQLIMLDAKLGCRSQDLLEQLAPSGCSTPAFAQCLGGAAHSHRGGKLGGVSEVRIWVNEHRSDNKVYHTHSTAESFHASMHQLLGQQKKLVLVSNSCKKAEELHHEIKMRYPTLPVLLLTSKSSDADKMADCNVKWLAYDVVIYSPTVGAGVDFNPTRLGSSDAIEHFHSILVWGEANSNPAREVVQMLGRVRKPRDNSVHLYLAHSHSPHEAVCTPESIREEIQHCFDTLNRGNKLDPALRQQMVNSKGEVESTLHEQLYVDLYIQNRMEKARSRVKFADLVLRDISDHLDTGRGGRVMSMDPDRLGKAAQATAKKDRLLAAEEQAQHECARIAQDSFVSEEEQRESAMRLHQLQGTERDKRLARKQHIQRTYNLREVPMVTGPWYDGLQPASGHGPLQQQLAGQPNPAIVSAGVSKLTEFVREHGSSGDLQQFKLFRLVNEPLHEEKLLFRRKARGRPEELPLQHPEWQDFETIWLLKGLLRVASFMTEEPCAAAAAPGMAACVPPIHTRMWEDAGDLCCLDSVDTDIVHRSVSEPEASRWLDDNTPWIMARFGCRLSCPYAVDDVVRALRAALREVGLSLSSHSKKKSCSDGGPRRTVTSWTLVSQRRDSLLELAYVAVSQSVSVHPRPLAHPISALAGWLSLAWDVSGTLEMHQPAFRWQLLTGVERPPHWRLVAPGESQGVGDAGKRSGKRKQKA